ncbi:hypothetical protein [Breznakia pachnodae]|uniref:Repeat protein (TIGR02543 family) n=1 Tax=Breznakia pachnodae TaxID=265178 RepID=A0ABU0E468_9FIRM|nr:hypothetical protein [Breznakia pachnodae]MDQ0361694.1 hypothetical protein [Breznakia pachnodae]
MQRLKLDKVFKVFIAAVVTITSLNIFNVILTANEEFNINETVTYSEDNKEAIISLDTASIDEKYVIEEIKDPTGEVMDLMDVNYKTDKNGDYNFIITYYDEEDIKTEYTKIVAVTEIEEDTLETEAVDNEATATETETIDRSSLLRASYTSQVTVNKWDILDANGDPLSTTNTAKSYSYYQYAVEWELTPSGGAVLHENDTFTISLPKNQTAGNWISGTSSWENFTDSSNVILGQWRITGGNVEVQLGENAEGKQSISGQFSTGSRALQNANSAGGVQNVVSGGVTKQIMFEQQTLSAINTNDLKSANSASNSRVQWTIALNNIGVTELTTPNWGSNFTLQNNTYVEDVLTGEYAGGFVVYAYFQNPVDLVTGNASGTGSGIPATSKFTQVYQSESEDYTTFKNRLNVFEYGVYEDAGGIQTLVINFGNIGNNGMKYSDLDANYANTFANNGISRGFYTESDRADLVDYYTQAYGDGNVIGGQVAKYRIDFSEDYPKVISDSARTNTAAITKNGSTVNRTATGTLQGISGSAGTVDANKARVFLSDVDTSSILEGVEMKLQIDSGGNWIDYAGWSGATISSDGYVDTSALGYGTYRFVQQAAYSSDYDLVNSAGYDAVLGKVVSSAFTIASGDTQGHVLYMTNVKKKYTVKYEPGDEGTFSTITHNNVVINTTTPAYNGTVGTDGKPSGTAGYEFAGWSPTLDSTVTQNRTYVAQWVPLTSTAYKVEHYQEQADGTYAVKDTDNLTGSTGATVSATAKTYEGYYFDSSVSGTLQSGAILGDGTLTLKLYYKARTNVVYKTEHYLQQSNGLYALHETDNLTGTAGHTVNATSKTYSGYAYDNTISGTKVSGVVVGDGSLVLKLYYKANTDTTYKVEHYQQQQNGTYTLKDTDNLSGTTGASVSATAKSYAGYTINLFHADTLFSGNIKGDGTLILKVYYSANTNTTYKVEHYQEQANNSYVLKDTDNLSGTTGATVSAVSKVYDGFTFDNTIAGTLESSTVLGDGSLTLKLYYKANTTTAYKVEHYIQQADGSYSLKDTDNLTGKTGATVNGTAKTYVGYTFDNTISGTVESGSIAGDGTLILKLHYKANTTTVYKIEHYQQQPNGSYTLKDTDNLTGTTGALATASVKTYAGYTANLFHTDTVLAGSIKGDGTLVLRLFYSANTNTTYKVEHYQEQPDGTYVLKDTDNLTGTTGTTVSGTAKTYAGFTYDSTVSGSLDSAAVLGDGTLILKFYYKANTNVDYTVEHYLEQPNGTYILKDTEALAGTTGATVSGTARTYAGYTFDNTVVSTVESGNILGDGTLVLKLYYTANTDTAYKTEHYLEQPDGTYLLEDTDNLSGTTGATVIAIAKTYAGYTFDNTVVSTVESGTILGDGSLTLKLYYTANLDTAYKVEHYLEQEDGTYAVEDTINMNGMTGDSVSATVNIYDGYTFDNTVLGTLEDGTILGDGSLTLKLYYTANTDTSYKVEHYLEQPNGTYVLEDTITETGTTGHTVYADDNTYAGYTLDTTVAETIESGVIAGDGSLVLKLYYTANTDTVYKVEHYLEQLDGTYVLTDTESFTGMTGDTVTVYPKTYTGYESASFLSRVGTLFISDVIKGDGSLVFEIKYTLTRHSVTYQPGDHGTFEEEVITNVAYGSDTPKLSVDVLGDAGYEFTGWSPKVDETVSKDSVYEATWTAKKDTKYTVEYYQQQKDGTYKLVESEAMSGVTDTNVLAEIKEYKGFKFAPTAKDTTLGGVIKGDGSLVLRLYYDIERTFEYKPSTATPGQNSGTNNSSLASNGVDTSDQTNVNLMIMMLLASLGSIIGLKKRKMN